MDLFLLFNGERAFELQLEYVLYLINTLMLSPLISTFHSHARPFVLLARVQLIAITSGLATVYSKTTKSCYHHPKYNFIINIMLKMT